MLTGSGSLAVVSLPPGAAAAGTTFLQSRHRQSNISSFGRRSDSTLDSVSLETLPREGAEDGDPKAEALMKVCSAVVYTAADAA